MSDDTRRATGMRAYILLALGAILVLPFVVMGPGDAPGGFEFLAVIGAVMLFVGLIGWVVSGRR